VSPHLAIKLTAKKKGRLQRAVSNVFGIDLRLARTVGALDLSGFSVFQSFLKRRAGGTMPINCGCFGCVTRMTPLRSAAAADRRLEGGGKLGR
jgi:hypothetical protein